MTLKICILNEHLKVLKLEPKSNFFYNKEFWSKIV